MKGDKEERGSWYYDVFQARGRSSFVCNARWRVSFSSYKMTLGASIPYSCWLTRAQRAARACKA
jgi:hypothetical protein